MTAPGNPGPNLFGKLATESTQLVEQSGTNQPDRNIAELLSEATERAQEFSILERRSVDALHRCLTTAYKLSLLISVHPDACAIFLEHVVRNGRRELAKPEKLRPAKLLLEAVKLATGAKNEDERKRASKYARALSHFIRLRTPPENLAAAILNQPGGLAGAAAEYTKSCKAASGNAPAPDDEEAPEAAVVSGFAPAPQQQDTTVQAATSDGKEVVIHALAPRSNELRRLRESNPEGCLSLLVKVGGAKLTLIKSRAAKINTDHHGDEEVEQDEHDKFDHHRRSRKPKSRWRRTG